MSALLGVVAQSSVEVKAEGGALRDHAAGVIMGDPGRMTPESKRLND